MIPGAATLAGAGVAIGNLGSGIMRVAIAGQEPVMARRCESAMALPGSNKPASFARWLLAVCCLIGATAVAGCARNPVQQEVRPLAPRAPARISHRSAPPPKVALSTQRPDPRRELELRIRKPDPDLLSHQPAPDCEFKRADVRAVDPDAWARLKAEYERQCYQNAEKTVRERLLRLQAANRCEAQAALRQ